MSQPHVTPRKRKAVAGDTPARSGVKAKGKGAPSPNLPLVPFPTPPRSRHRRAGHLEAAETSSDAGPSAPAVVVGNDDGSVSLPPHLQTLLTLHRAFNLALSLHIATHPPVLPPHPPSATRIMLPNLTNILALKESVERTGGRRFGIPELQRLAWLWAWDGISLADGKSQGDKSALDDNPFLVSPTADACPALEVTGLGYVISPTRTLDSNTGRRVYTYGIGIELDLKPGETRQLLHGGSEGGIGNKGQGGGLGAVGRWNGAGEDREEVMKQRLMKWVELNGGSEEVEAGPDTSSGLPTPAHTREGTRSTIPPIPLLALPHLPSSTLLPAANLFSSVTNPVVSSPSPQKQPSMLADPFKMDEGAEKAKVVRPGSVEERRQAMMDRIKARKGGKAPLPTLGSAIANGPRFLMSKADTAEELKRRSTLSRLESVAEGVWMMFSAPPPGAAPSSTPTRSRRKAIQMTEAAEIIVKSSKTPISIAEAQTSLTLLTELCPFFLTQKTVARQDWLEMPTQLAQAPTSPVMSSSSRLSATLSSPSRSTPKGLRSPGAASALADADLPAAIAGPASPGRVRRFGGLREVRERIRRELGE